MMNSRLMPEIKKILYATDLSENARYAFGYAMSLANRYGAGITILHVLQDLHSYRDSLVMNILGEDKWQELRKGHERQVLEMLKGRLEKFCEEVGSDLPTCPFITDEILVKIGNPVEEILNLGEEGNFDLVVMGAHGHGMLANAMMGSTSRRVMRHCRKPVLIVRLP